MLYLGDHPVERDTGAAVLEDWEKMSKSKYNGVDPQDMLDTYGVDATRLCILANVAPKSDRHWSDDGMYVVVCTVLWSDDGMYVCVCVLSYGQMTVCMCTVL